MARIPMRKEAIIAAGMEKGGRAAPIPAAALSMESANPRESASPGERNLSRSLSALSAWSQQEWSKSLVMPRSSRTKKLIVQVCLGVSNPVKRFPVSNETASIRLEIEVRIQREESGIRVRLTP